MKQMSKRLLTLDYVITVLLLIAFFVCVGINANAASRLADQSTAENAVDLSCYATPVDLSTLGIIISAWIAQVGVSSAAYYVLIKSEHKVELPMRLINELPDDIKDNVDLTSIIETVLTSTEN